MHVRALDHTHIGRQVTLPTLSALGRCRRGTLHAIRAAGTGLTRLQIDNHLFTCPDNAVIFVTDTVEVNGL